MTKQITRHLGIPSLVAVGALASACSHAEQDQQEFRSTYATSVTIGGDSSDDGGPTCDPDTFFDVEARRSLFETNEDALSSFSMQEVLAALGNNTGISADPTALHDQLMDTFAQSPGVTGGAHCDDDVAFNGGPGLNGYPLQCPRAERFQVGNMDEWFPIAAVNRFDLAPSDGANCGEARLVFANNAPIGPGRNFVIFEAKIPNPEPGCGIDACAPVQEFWADLSNNDNPLKRGDALRRAFLDGHAGLQAAGFEPFVNASAFGFGAGQVRTNSFNQGPWTLREFKTVAVFQKSTGLMANKPPESFIHFVPVPVAANPFGQLWDDSAALPNSKACANAIVDTVANLMVDDPNLMGVSMPVECLAAESPNQSVMDYRAQLNANGPLAKAIENRIQLLDPGSTLTPTHIANRALFAGGCIGCHQRSNSGANADLGNGTFAPQSAGFVHTLEFASTQEDCGDGNLDCFRISPALRDSFLPHRKQVMDDFLNSGPCCESAGGITPSPIGVEPFDADELDIDALVQAEAAAQASVSQITVAGQSTHRAH